MKQYEVKVYDTSDNYITTWKDVVSDVQFNNEINSAGGQMTLTLARNAGDYGEGTDIDFNFKVKVYVIDKEEPNGKLIFQGFISGYTPIYKNDTVEVTILSYGSELNGHIIEGGETAYISNETYSTDITFASSNVGSYSRVGQSFTTTTATNLSRVVLYLKCGQAYHPTLGFYQATNRDVSMQIRTGATAESGTLLGTSNTVTVADENWQAYSFTFSPTLELDATTVYHFVLYPEIYEQYTAGALVIKEGSGYAGGVTKLGTAT